VVAAKESSSDDSSDSEVEVVYYLYLNLPIQIVSNIQILFTVSCVNVLNNNIQIAS